MALTAEWTVPKAVMIMTIGRSLPDFSFSSLIFPRSSIPSIPSIFRSVRTISGLYAFITLRASPPEDAS